MKRYLQAGLLTALSASVATVLWLGVSGSEHGTQAITGHQADTQAMSEIFGDRQKTAAVATNATTQPSASATAPITKPVTLTAEQRQLILAEFVKAADKEMAKVQNSIDEARNADAPAEQIAVQENKLRMMQQFKQDTLARNAS